MDPTRWFAFVAGSDSFTAPSAKEHSRAEGRIVPTVAPGGMTESMIPRSPRYAVAIPVIFHEGTLPATGMTQNISATGALIINASAQPPVGTRAQFRLHTLQQVLRTSGPDSIELLAAVARHVPDGFAVDFGERQSRIEGLLERAHGRGILAGPRE